MRGIMMTAHFKQRLKTSYWITFLLVIIIYFSQHFIGKSLFLFSIGLITGSALLEYYQLAQQKAIQPFSAFGCLFAMLAPFVLYESFISHEGWNFMVLFLFVIFGLSFFYFFKRKQNALANLAVTFFGYIYLVLPLSLIVIFTYFPHLQTLEDGRLWLSYILVVTKMTDVGAYFIGKIFGKTKLLPLISPNKTIAGAWGGLGFSILASFLFYKLFSHLSFAPGFTLAKSLWVGISISILAQIGDLAESLFKRDADKKDSSSLPGLGGILDMIDSLCFTLPFFYFLLVFRIVY